MTHAELDEMEAEYRDDLRRMGQLQKLRDRRELSGYYLDPQNDVPGDDDL